MPIIYRYFGLSFFFYSQEHLPIHVHVRIANTETKFELRFDNGVLVEIKEKKIRGVDHLPANKRDEAKKFINFYHNEIVNLWKSFFILSEPIKTVTITTKLK